MQDPCSLSTFEPWMLIYVASWWFQIRSFLRWWSTLTFVSLGPVWLTHGSVHGPWIDFKSILEEYLVPDRHPTLKLQVNSTYPWNILHVLRAPSGSSRHFSETSRGPQFDFPIPNPVWRGSGSSNKKTRESIYMILRFIAMQGTHSALGMACGSNILGRMSWSQRLSGWIPGKGHPTRHGVDI
jgi:hypothetical protein